MTISCDLSLFLFTLPYSYLTHDEPFLGGHCKPIFFILFFLIPMYSALAEKRYDLFEAIQYKFLAIASLLAGRTCSEIV